MSFDVAVLGGSSPFTISLIDALAVRPDLTTSLVLHGRDRAMLAAVARYAGSHLGVPVTVTTDVAEAVAAGTVVIHQIRYGGSQGRVSDAALAESFGVPADETLGVAGLLAAIRLRKPLTELGRVIRATRPDVWLINLTNPMSVAVALLKEAGVDKVVGVCELPAATEAAARKCAGAPASTWHYQGLNHRGVLYGMGWFDDFLAGVRRSGGFAGVPVHVIEELGAVPMKYLRLAIDREARRRDYERPSEVAGIRVEAVAELLRNPLAAPQSLAMRPTPWYAEGVIPALTAIRDGGRCIASLPDRSGLAHEAWVDFSGPTILEQPEPGPAVRKWLDRWDAHEHAVLAAARTTTPELVRSALRLDPVTDLKYVDAMVSATLEHGGALWATA